MTKNSPKLHIPGPQCGETTSNPSHYLNQCWHVVNKTLGNKLQWNFNLNSNVFIQENAFANVVWKMATILSQPQCVNRSSWSSGGDWWLLSSVADVGDQGGISKTLNLRALKFSPLNKIHISQCMGNMFCVKFQRVPPTAGQSNILSSLKTWHHQQLMYFTDLSIFFILLNDTLWPADTDLWLCARLQ